jgi:hypothetical protein
MWPGGGVVHDYWLIWRRWLRELILSFDEKEIRKGQCGLWGCGMLKRRRCNTDEEAAMSDVHHLFVGRMHIHGVCGWFFPASYHFWESKGSSSGHSLLA